MSKYFYAVRVGNIPGIYNTWSECERQVKGFKGAKFKKFKLYDEAIEFLQVSNESEIKEILKEDIKEKINDEIDINKSNYDCNQEDILEDEIVSYVDGSFNLGEMIYSYGVVMITKDKIEEYNGKEDDPVLAQMRNVSGELKAAMVAMDIAMEKGYKKLSIYYDYAGIEKWAMGEWKTNKAGTRDYKKYYDSIKGKLQVKFIKVPAHAGVKYNELADKLAKEAIQG